MKKFSYLCTTKKRKDMDKKKIFTSNAMPEIFYQVMEEGWLDDDTYVIVFQDMVDVDGDTFHMEVEYHKDEERITYTRVYDYENVDGTLFISPCFKKQIDEYILKQTGVINGILTKQKIALELTLDIDPKMSVGELRDWLKECIQIQVDSYGGKATAIKVENLGWIK